MFEVDEKLALAMCAGARAIEQNKRYLACGTHYLWDVFGNHKRISYAEAARILREAAEPALRKEDADGQA